MAVAAFDQAGADGRVEREGAAIVELIGAMPTVVGAKPFSEMPRVQCVEGFTHTP